MTKQELINRVAAMPVATGMSRKQVGALVDAVFANLAQYFVEARPKAKKRSAQARFTYPGFGTFTKKRRGARTVRNPQTGAPIEIPETVTLAFQPGQELKAQLNGAVRSRRRA